jgi:hypothetical protein
LEAKLEAKSEAKSWWVARSSASAGLSDHQFGRQHKASKFRGPAPFQTLGEYPGRLPPSSYAGCRTRLTGHSPKVVLQGFVDFGVQALVLGVISRRFEVCPVTGGGDGPHVTKDVCADSSEHGGPTGDALEVRDDPDGQVRDVGFELAPKAVLSSAAEQRNAARFDAGGADRASEIAVHPEGKPLKYGAQQVAGAALVAEGGE